MYVSKIECMQALPAVSHVLAFASREYSVDALKTMRHWSDTLAWYGNPVHTIMYTFAPICNTKIVIYFGRCLKSPLLARSGEYSLRQWEWAECMRTSNIEELSGAIYKSVSKK